MTPARRHRIANAHRYVRVAHLLHVARLSDQDLRETDTRYGIDRKEVTGRGCWPTPEHLTGFRDTLNPNPELELDLDGLPDYGYGALWWGVTLGEAS